MRLRHLALSQFRVYRQLELALPAGPLVLVGQNAQGKTSLLEAIYALATSRAPGGVPDRQLIRWQARQDEVWPFCRVQGLIERRDGELQLEILTAWQAGEAAGEDPRLVKRIRVNQVQKRAMDLLGQFNVVLFSPEDLSIVAGAPAERRRYLDGLLCQVDPAYCRALSRYNQVLSQRNHLLKLIRERRAAAGELPFWDERLLQDGALILEARQRAVAGLERLAADLHLQVAGGGPPLSLAYRFSWQEEAEDEAMATGDVPGDAAFVRSRQDGAQATSPVPAPAATPVSSVGARTPMPASPPADTADPNAAPASAEALRGAFAAALAASQPAQLARGLTLVGPHRDDLAFRVGTVDMRSFGSRGQQRSVALALRLAEARLMTERRGEAPVVLLDDVLSELDPGRRERLLGLLDRVEQSILTTADLAVLPPDWLAKATVLEVAGGRVGRPGQLDQPDGRVVGE